MTSLAILRRIGVLVVLAGAGHSLSAASTLAAEGANGTVISLDDIQADAHQRVPAARRHLVLSQPDAVQQAAQNLYVRRVLAAEAVRDGLDKDPIVAATLQLLRDRVLSDARLARIDQANKPSPQAVEAAAREIYRAAPERYKTPDQARARHILILGHTDQAEREAERLHTVLKGGADFATVAREKSQDNSAERGGDLGWFEKGKMVPEFELAVDKLKSPGEISAPIRTQFGWHIIKLEGRRPGGQRSFDDVADELRSKASDQLQSDARLKEVRRIVENFKPDRKAIEAFAATQKQ